MLYNSHAEYRKAWDDAATIDPPVPLNIDLELASVCNLRCPFCFVPDPAFEKFISQKSDDGKPLRRLMPKEVAFKIIDDCARMGVPALKFNWRGESTLHPQYAEIVQYAREKRNGEDRHRTWAPGRTSIHKYSEPAFLELLANTNANCNDKAIDGLFATTKCMVSLDSMDEEIYPQMRVGGKLARAKEVITELIRRGHPNLWARRVLSKTNYKEPFFERVKERWGDAVHVSQHYCFDRNVSQNHELSGCDHDSGLPRKYCQYPSQRLVVASTGKVYPCCIDLHETMPVGDINKQSLAEIWQGEPIRKLRAVLRSGDIKLMSKTCQGCESWLAYDVPQRAFVKDIEILNEADAVAKTF